MSNWIDADDRRIIAQGVVYLVLVVGLLIVLSAAVGLAWTVLRLTGGL